MVTQSRPNEQFLGYGELELRRPPLSSHMSTVFAWSCAAARHLGLRPEFVFQKRAIAAARMQSISLPAVTLAFGFFSGRASIQIRRTHIAHFLNKSRIVTSH